MAEETQNAGEIAAANEAQFKAGDKAWARRGGVAAQVALKKAEGDLGYVVVLDSGAEVANLKKAHKVLFDCYTPRTWNKGTLPKAEIEAAANYKVRVPGGAPKAAKTSKTAKVKATPAQKRIVTEMGAERVRASDGDEYECGQCGATFATADEVLAHLDGPDCPNAAPVDHSEDGPTDAEIAAAAAEAAEAEKEAATAAA